MDDKKEDNQLDKKEDNQLDELKDNKKENSFFYKRKPFLNMIDDALKNQYNVGFFHGTILGIVSTISTILVAYRYRNIK
jgi:hypothetical protein